MKDLKLSILMEALKMQRQKPNVEGGSKRYCCLSCYANFHNSALPLISGHMYSKFA